VNRGINWWGTSQAANRLGDVTDSRATSERASAGVPERPTLDGLEDRWGECWENDHTYRFERGRTRDGVYAIDTPPPTVSGSLHVGSVFSYSQTDLVARYQRMRGKRVFYPIGWDDNGLATERRVQNFYGVRCDPSMPHDPDFTPPAAPAKAEVPVDRTNFISLCERRTAEDEQAFEQLFRRLGLSIDWEHSYTTIDERSRRAAQRAFLRNLARGEAYHAEAPTLWDVDYRTAVAQAELEDREIPGAYHRLAFGDLMIETTRPELVPACVALVAHPDDKRYSDRFGTTVRTPLFDVEVPVVAHGLADPDKGSGMAMVCTFGDLTDVRWWRELDLPVRSIIGRDGRIVAEPPAGVPANAAWSELVGRTVKQAQRRIVELLRDAGDLQGEPRPITHPVKFYERGERPLEIVTSRQWYIRNGGRDEELRADLLKRGAELSWHPSTMRLRYDNWVAGLIGDWLISRQRFFGVPVPVWYPLGQDGQPDYGSPLVPPEVRLPVDPASDVPEGYTEDQRDSPAGFTGDPDVMDTWATSSLTPQIAGRWVDDPELFAEVFPYDLRPQAHEIIRTWLFATLLRAHLEHGSLPWTDAAISGWVVDPDRKKMSKSKGNVVTPMALLEQYGADAVRYWAASARLGVDTTFDEAQMRVGRRLAVKLLNASRFVLAFPDGGDGPVTAPLDRAMLAQLASVVEDVTAAYDDYDHAGALNRTEAFFWTFCDDYVELVKTRAYAGGDASQSATRALRLALSTLLRLFAPVLPFVSEEVWSWWQHGSIHRAAWPDAASLRAAGGATGEGAVLDVLGDVLGRVRKAKSEAKVSMRAPVDRLLVSDSADRLTAIRAGQDDLASSGSIAEIVLTEGVPVIDVTLAASA
jgi:valyl-tRNA synthetase